MSVQTKTRLKRDVFEKVMAKFGFRDVPSPSKESLNAVYKAWCQGVGYDNVQKRIFYASGTKGPFPVMDPNDFLTQWMQHGTSGSCWPSAEALFGIITHMGFNVRRVAGQMLDCGDPTKPNHGTQIVTLDGEELFVDTGMVAEEVLSLKKGTATSTASKAFGIWSKGDGKIWWKPGHSRQEIETVIQFDPCTNEYFEERYEATKAFSLFNHTIYIRRNRDNGILTYGRGNVVTVTPEGELSAKPITPEELPKFLIERMGLSEEIVSRIPADSSDAPAF